MKIKIILIVSFLLSNYNVQSQILDSYIYTTKLTPPAKYYGASYNYYTPFMPLAVCNSYTSDPSLVWYGLIEPVKGIRVTEYGDFFLNKFFPAIIEAMTTTPSEAWYEWDDKSDKWVFSHYSQSEPGIQITPSPSGSYIEFYKSAEFTKFYIATLYKNSSNGAIGMGFGFSKIKNITSNSSMHATGDFGNQLRKYSTSSLYESGGRSMNFLDLLLQWNLDVKYLGNIQFSHTIPSMSLFTFTNKMKLGMLGFGVFPYTGATIQRSIGPLRFGLTANVPAKFIVIPWYFKAIELNFSCGLAF